MAKPTRKYDVILYGASGFVGAQTVPYFAQHAQGLRWALAGRNATKLEAVRTRAGSGAADAAARSRVGSAFFMRFLGHFCLERRMGIALPVTELMLYYKT